MSAYYYDNYAPQGWVNYDNAGAISNRLSVSLSVLFSGLKIQA